jgi:hypothetical protein
MCYAPKWEQQEKENLGLITITGEVSYRYNWNIHKAFCTCVINMTRCYCGSIYLHVLRLYFSDFYECRAIQASLF